jgi:hypothetical protein
MTSQPDVLQAAREIRPYLPELLTSADLERVVHRLEQAIAAAQDQPDQSDTIRGLLSETELTREWMRLYLEEGKPAAEILTIIRTYKPLPGKAGAIASPRYRCPVASCHQTWYRRAANADIPDCPIHGVKMVRESKVQASSSPDEAGSPGR